MSKYLVYDIYFCILQNIIMFAFSICYTTMQAAFNTQMVILARESRGLSQLQLADAIGMSATNLSKIERADISIATETVEKIAIATQYPLPFFYRAGDIVPENLNYRKREVVAQKLITPVHAMANVYRMQVQTITALLQVQAPALPKLPVTNNQSPAQAANKLRQLWQIPEGPLANLTTIMENKGIVTCNFNFGTVRIDSRSMLTTNRQPIIFTNNTLGGDRQRFSLAYELGQLIMHTFVNLSTDADITHEANLFAAALLMPEKEIRKDFDKGITIPILAQLKTKWKVSMIALLYRADDLGYLTPNQKRYLLQQFNTLKIRRREPIELDIATETPTLLKSMEQQLRNKLQLNVIDMANLLCLNTEEYLEQYFFNSTDKNE